MRLLMHCFCPIQMENLPNWHIKPSFINELSISYPKGYFSTDSISDGLSYHTPMITFYYRLEYSDYNTNLPLTHEDGYFSHPAYEYIKFVLDTINSDERIHYDLQCELRLMTDVPMESWIMNRECTDFKFYPEEYDLDTNIEFYCSVSVIFHNVIGTKLLLSNLFMRMIKDISTDNNTIDRYNEYSQYIFGGSYGTRSLSRLRLRLHMEVLPYNTSTLNGSSLMGLVTYVPWMMPDEMDKILADLYGNNPIVTLIGYINRNISMFVRYDVTINDIPPIDGLTVKQVKLILNKILPHKRTRRIINDSSNRKNIERYSYNPDFSPNIYAVINNESAISEMSKLCSSLRGLKRYSFEVAA